MRFSSLSPDSWLAGLVRIGAMVVLAALSAPANSAVFSCPTADGEMQFQDRPCQTVNRQTPDNTRPEVSRQRLNLLTPPAGIHVSWFERPDGIAHEVLCDKKGCECGSMQRNFDSGLALAVADALYVDGSWHRYQTSVADLLDATKIDDAAGVAVYRTAMEEAACEIMMSQLTLRQFADTELRRLRRRAQDTEDLGRDDESACDGFSETACADYMDLLLYRSMSGDAQSLSQPRGVSVFNALD